MPLLHTVRRAVPGRAPPSLCERVTPVVLVLLFIAWIYTSYIVTFCLPLANVHPTLGRTCIAVCSFLTFMTIWAYTQAVLTHPGTVPAEKFGFGVKGLAVDRRQPKCQACMVYKPLRAHHCSKCQQCILQYDHHCPWINNCVGLRNKKHFLLFMLYANLNVVFICTTSYREVITFHSEHSLQFMGIHDSVNFALVWAFTVVVGFFLIVFCLVHCKLVIENRTTVEAYLISPATNPYDKGLVANVQHVCGANVLLWLLPLQPKGLDDGFDFFEECTDPVNGSAPDGQASDV
eukprot:GGOE01014747.1.p1 GENE.GGOE01014747.1~~GGOE01014747.1.p1  ORF type:complete len:290 (+),score=77.22 GGOE01014747.1:59-928(+)